MGNLSDDPENKALYRSAFNSKPPVFRAAWQNSGPHHEMLIRKSAKRRKLDVLATAPRKEAGEQKVEAAVVVAQLRSTNDGSSSNDCGGNGISVAEPRPAQREILSNKQKRLNRGGKFVIP